MTKPPIVPASSFRIFPGDRTCTDAVAGDLVLVRHDTLPAKGIRFFERLRKPVGLDRLTWAAYCWANHAATVLTGGPGATVAQAEAAGIIATPLATLDAQTYAVVHIECGDHQRAAAGEFSGWAVGCGYGWAQIPADAFNAVTGLELSLGWGCRMVCSTQATRTAERMGLIPDRSPDAVTPAHLCSYFDVRLPEAS